MPHPSSVASPSPPTLADACRRIQEISTLPHVALRVIEVANDPESGARELKNVMEADAALSTRVLRCVNSSAYATKTKITNLQHAIAYLGVKQVRNLAMTASVSQLFDGDDTIGTYCRTALWRHLVAAGICARLIAMRLRLRDFEDIFMAGLLHDIGIILEDESVHGAFIATVQSLQEGQSLLDAEQRFLGFDHTRLGEEIAKAWRLPCGVTDTIRYHHDSAGYRGQYLATVQCVEVANFICSLRGMSSMGLNLVRFPREAIAALALKKEDLVVLASDLDRELEGSQTLLQM